MGYVLAVLGRTAKLSTGGGFVIPGNRGISGAGGNLGVEGIRGTPFWKYHKIPACELMLNECRPVLLI